MAANSTNALEMDVFQESMKAETVGRLFREERERRQLSVKDVSKELHIRQLYLSCIEEGRLSELPGYVYVVGFIKSYSRFLELNEEEMLRQLQLTSQNPVIYPNFMTSIPTKEQQMPSKKVLFGSLTLFFVFALLAYVYNNNTQEVFSERDELAPSQRNKDLVTAIPEEFSPVNFSQADLPQVEASISPSSSTPMNVIQSKSVPENSELKVVSAPMSASTAASEMTIIAVKDSWVQIMNSKGNSVYVRLMHAGERYVIPATTQSGPQKDDSGPYVLNTGNGGGIKISVNGQESKVLGSEGKILRGIILSPEKVKEFMGE